VSYMETVIIVMETMREKNVCLSDGEFKKR